MSIVHTAIRVDASEQIGTGHFMRCLALADVLKQNGSKVRFISRCLPEYLQEVVAEKGHMFVALDSHPNENIVNDLAHSHWLNTSQNSDAQDSMRALSDQVWDWLIVDHYALDSRWERCMCQLAQHIMVIDDLVDRKHDCDLLLDQTYGRKKEEYRSWVPTQCKLLTGSTYSLLRPEFSNLRRYSLERRAEPKLKRMLISMGGVDKFNVTGKVLQVLQGSDLPKDFQVTVVMGRASKWVGSVEKQARQSHWKTEVKVGVDEVAKLMAESDLAIGAAGSTAWERCCLGLPTIMLVLADNQNGIAQALGEVQAVVLVNEVSEITECVNSLYEHPEKLSELSQVSSSITDGNGLKHVFQYMKEVCEQ